MGITIEGPVRTLDYFDAKSVDSRHGKLENVIMLMENIEDKNFLARQKPSEKQLQVIEQFESMETMDRADTLKVMKRMRAGMSPETSDERNARQQLFYAAR